MGLPFRDHPGLSACHLLPILLPEGTLAPGFYGAMNSAGIQTSIHYPPMHHFSAYRDAARPALPLTEALAAREVTLPLYPSLSEEDVRYVVEAVRESL